MRRLNIDNLAKRALGAAVFSVAILCPFAQTLAADSQAPLITVQKNQANGALYSKFEFHAPVSTKTFSLSNPERFVVDVYGATLATGMAPQFNVDSNTVSRVRIAQNSAEPPVVRIVLELKKSGKPAMSVDEKNGIVVIGDNAGKAAPVISTAAFGKISIKKNMADVETVMTFKQKPVYKKDMTYNPPRMILDFPGYTAGEAAGEFIVKEGIVKSVTVAQLSSSPAVTRVYVETNLPAEFQIEESNDGKTISLKTIQPSVYGKRICVDPGHGGKDPGAQVRTGDEKEIVLSVGLKLRELLEKSGAKVIMTRSDDTFIELKRRAEIANNAGADIFLSVHTNALINHEYKMKVRGIQVFHYKDRGKEFARVVRDELAKTEGVGDWGVYDRSLSVLRNTTMKAALVELGFMTHPDDMALMNNETFRDNAARGLYNGLEKYFGSRGKELAALELPSELISRLVVKPGDRMYAAVPVALTPSTAVAKQPAADSSHIPDYVDVVPVYEAGLTHEVGSKSSGSNKAKASPGL